MECINCGEEFDEEYYDSCPYCGCSTDAIRCPDCGQVIDDDVTCSVCGYMLHDPYEEYCDSDEDSDTYDYSDEDEDEEYTGEDICENCTYWQTHSRGSAFGMICQRTGLNTDPDDSCEYFSKMFHFTNYGEEGQYSFIDTEQEKKRKLDNWRNRKF